MKLEYWLPGITIGAGGVGKPVDILSINQIKSTLMETVSKDFPHVASPT